MIDLEFQLLSSTAAMSIEADYDHSLPGQTEITENAFLMTLIQRLC
jgi:hypothetical protein